MGAVTLSGVRKLFGAMEVIKGIDLTVADRELVVFVGPSGCGKSTLLRMIAGLEDVDYGTILIAGKDVTENAPAKRGVAMVFQNYALYPHMSAYDNMAYGLRRAGLAQTDVDRRVRDTAKLLQITELTRAVPRQCRAANASAWPSDGPSSATRKCSCSTNRSRTSTRACGSKCAARSRGCIRN